MAYVLWHTYFINEEDENVSVKVFGSWFQGPMNSHFQTTSILKPQGQ